MGLNPALNVSVALSYDGREIVVEYFVNRGRRFVRYCPGDGVPVLSRRALRVHHIRAEAAEEDRAFAARTERTPLARSRRQPMDNQREKYAYMLSVIALRYTIRDAILTCAQSRHGSVYIIYRTEPTTKK